MRISACGLILIFFLNSSGTTLGQVDSNRTVPDGDKPFVVVLGNAQDAGYPQANCRKPCCRAAWSNPGRRRSPTSLAVVDPVTRTKILFECTPDYPKQIHRLNRIQESRVGSYDLAGIFLTHAHIGHYAGLIHLGREVEGARGVPVYVMPRMREFLIGNGPWSQLVELKNIQLKPLTPHETVRLGRVRITPIPVPHRDEFSETVAFRIQGPGKSLLFLPDIDKWERWKMSIEKEILKVDYALLDGTFFDGQELPNRDMSAIPHPFVVESMRRFATLPAKEKTKIHFIHLNHTNPLLNPDSPESDRTKKNGFHIAEQGKFFSL